MRTLIVLSYHFPKYPTYSHTPLPTERGKTTEFRTERMKFSRLVASILRRSSPGIRRLTISTYSKPSDRDLRFIARSLAGILAVGGGVIFIQSPGLQSYFDLKDPRFILGESFRRRVFFNYEKRLRLRSRPEKIFEYFASSRGPEGEVFMSAADLMRAVVPVFPPSESHIIREGHLRGEPLPGELHCDPSPLFMLFDTNSDGLISFPEYIFFVTLLSIPESNFSVTFKIFDLDGSGEIDREEFKQVMALMRSYNRQGACRNNGLRFGLKVSKSIENAGLVEYFFGKDGEEKLQHEKFVMFLRELHDEIVRLEFDHYDYTSRKTISSKDFALSMVASADINHINKFLDLVDKMDHDPNMKTRRITFEEFKTFADLRKKLQPLSLAIFSYGKVNGCLTKEDFKRAASQVCGVPLTDNVVEIIFHIFDTNRDGNISMEEFLRIIQNRENDIRHPTVPGLIGRLSCCLSSSNSPAISIT